MCCDPGAQRLCNGRCMQGVLVRVEVLGSHVAKWGLEMLMGRLMRICDNVLEDILEGTVTGQERQNRFN